MRRWLLLMLVFGLAGCTTLSDTRKAAIRNVAVISAIGDDVTLFRILGSKEKPERVDWTFDRIATDAITQSVRSVNAGVSVVPVDYDSNVLAAGIHKYEAFEPFADSARIEPTLRKITQGKSIDTIILVARNSSENGALLRFEGVGVVTERTVLPAAPIIPFAGLTLFVIDGTTMRVLSRQTALIKGPTYNVKPLIEFAPVGGPAPFLPGFTFPMNDEQKNFLRPILQGFVFTGIQRLMRDSGF